MANQVRRQLGSIPKEMRTDLWLSSNSDCRKICKIVYRVTRKRIKSKLLYQDDDVITLADKCIVVYYDYDKCNDAVLQ